MFIYILRGFKLNFVLSLPHSEFVSLTGLFRTHTNQGVPRPISVRPLHLKRPPSEQKVATQPLPSEPKMPTYIVLKAETFESDNFRRKNNLNSHSLGFYAFLSNNFPLFPFSPQKT